MIISGKQIDGLQKKHEKIGNTKYLLRAELGFLRLNGPKISPKQYNSPHTQQVTN
jgi:hypothetical protein